MKRFWLCVGGVVILLSANFNLEAQYSLTTISYSQVFDDLDTANSTVAGGDLNLVNANLNGWYFFETGANANTTIAAGTGSNITGDVYNFGSAIFPSDRGLGGLQSGTLLPAIGFYFTNNTGSVITSITISYVGEQWRLGAIARTDRLNFQYSTDATALSSGVWTDVNALDFTAPNTGPSVGALDGNLPANQSNISNTITGVNIVNGATIFFRWNDLNAPGNDDGLAVDEFVMIVGTAPASTDCFRSIVTGDWNANTTWQSSPDNINWVAATATPTSAANTITITTATTVTITATVDADQVVIQNGATLNHSSGTFTIDDGAGNDIDIQNGGSFTLSFAGGPSFGAGSPVVNIATGGILRVSASGLTGAATGVNASNYLYQHQSILEYTLNGAFSSVAVTYFPNVSSSTIPIFRTTNTSNLLVGSDSFTTFNGKFEANGVGNIIWQNGGDKTFRNGIRGTGNVTANASAATAKFIINGGSSCELGGTGSLIVPTAGGLQIGNNTTVVMSSDKTVTGDISLLSSSTIQLAAHNLTVTGNISGGAVTSFIITAGTGGMLTLKNVVNKVFPIGYNSYAPVTITNGGGVDYSMHVINGISPSPGNPFAAVVLRTWTINTTATTGVTVGFQFNNNEWNPSFNTSATAEIGQNISGVWNVVDAGLPVSGTGPYTVSTSAITSFNTAFIIGNSGAILPLDYFISCHAQKSNSRSIISWQIADCASTDHFEIERSLNGTGFKKIGQINLNAPAIDYSFTDYSPGSGNNLYRIKSILKSGRIKYSNVAAVVHNSAAVFISAIYPNPPRQNTSAVISSGENADIELTICDAQGRIVTRSGRRLISGTNIFLLPVNDLSQGIYFLYGETKAGKTNIVRFMKE